jgi:hypothetical protein
VGREVEAFDGFVDECTCITKSEDAKEQDQQDVRFSSSFPSAVPLSKTPLNHSLISVIRCFRSYIVGCFTSPPTARSAESKISNS